MSEDKPQEAFHIPDVPLQKIFQHLGVKDLLDCRLVSKQWSVIAQVELQARRAFINLDKLGSVRVAKDEWKESSEVLTANLKFLSERLQTEQYFPFLGMIIGKENWTNRTHVKEFCRNFGSIFQRLYLKKVPSLLAAELLGRCFTNVKHLIVDLKYGVQDTARSHDSCIVSVDPIHHRYSYLEIAPLILDGRYTLPPMERITIVDDREYGVSYGRHTRQITFKTAYYALVKRIVEAAPNLKRVDNFHFWLYSCFQKCGKLETITKLSVDYKFFSTRCHLVDFTLNAPVLTSLEIRGSVVTAEWPEEPQGWDQIRVESEIKILTASQNTLEHLAVEKLSGPVPLLPALKSLWILKGSGSVGGRPYRIFDTEGPPSSYFPDLETVRIFVDITNAKDVNQYFQNGQGLCLLESVRTLELVGGLHASAFPLLRTIFPNIQRLRVHWRYWQYFSWHYKTRVSDLWNCGWDLTDLEIYGYDEKQWNTLPQFEAFVTGIPRRKLERLRQRLEKAPLPVNTAEIETLQTEPSICNMKCLKKFRVFFSGEYMLNTLKDEEARPKAVPLAFFCGWRLVPGLQTLLEYDFRADTAGVLGKALAPYAEQVSIQHRDNDEEF